MDIILIAGLWLPETAWDEVAAEIEQLDHRPRPVSLPGVDDGARDAVLADQLTTVLGAVDAADRPIVVGHSAACTLAWMAADRRPDTIEAVVLVGGFPASHGESYAGFFEPVDGVVPFPGWESFEGADAADLGPAERDRMATDAIPVAEGVAKSIVELGDDRRFDVPVVLVCPEYSPEQAREWIEGGEVPELATANRVTYVDIDTGHWPMITQPALLAGILADIARSV